MQAAIAAESPTLKAAVDTYAAEAASANVDVRQQLLNTIRTELAKMADSIHADAIVLVDTAGTALAAAGDSSSGWPVGERLTVVDGSTTPDARDGIVHVRNTLFRVVAVPLLVNDGTTVGSVYLATRLDGNFARQLGELAQTDTAILSNDTVVATTLDGV